MSREDGTFEPTEEELAECGKRLTLLLKEISRVHGEVELVRRVDTAERIEAVIGRGGKRLCITMGMEMGEVSYRYGFGAGSPTDAWGPDYYYLIDGREMRTHDEALRQIALKIGG